MELHGRQDDEIPIDDDISITSSSSVSSSPTQNDNQDSEMEYGDEPPNDTEDDSNDFDEISFDYHGFTQMELPDIYKRNFADLAWKARCNVSDNAYDQLKYTRDGDFWSLKVCRKRLFDISSIETIDIDCCRKGKCTCCNLILTK